MKKLNLFLAGALIFSFASCKKKYTCLCTGNPGTTSNNEYQFEIKDTKSNAESTCKSYMPAYNECHLK